MQTFTASRLSEGNKTFPIKIIIDNIGVTLQHPGLFSGEEQTIPFSRISSVNVQTPIIGFSTITIQTAGHGQIEAHGFTRAEVTEMKQLIIARL